MERKPWIKYVEVTSNVAVSRGCPTGGLRIESLVAGKR